MSYLARPPFEVNPLRDIESQSPECVMAMCLFGEARGADVKAKAGVAHVLLTRAGWRPGRFFSATLAAAPLVTRVAGSALQRLQFSCFNASDPNRARLLSGNATEAAAWAECIAIAAAALDGLLRDPTGGANHYHTLGLKDQILGRWPAWAKVKDQTAEIGAFKFYRLA